MQTWLARNQLDFKEVVLENGAGLSRKERISAAHMAQLLQHAFDHPLSAELQASLPILGVDGSVKRRLKESPAASHAHLKTGTLEGVKTIAGYVRSQHWPRMDRRVLHQPPLRQGRTGCTGCVA